LTFFLSCVTISCGASFKPLGGLGGFDWDFSRNLYEKLLASAGADEAAEGEDEGAEEDDDLED
jgi:hypothetical protein